MPTLLVLALSSCAATAPATAVETGAPTFACSDDDSSGCVAMAIHAGREHPEERARAARILKDACDHSEGSSCVAALVLALSDVPWLRVLELGVATQGLNGREVVLFGRPFVVERFAVRVDMHRAPEAWSLTAKWTASDGVRIWADFEGPLDAVTTTLRSSPPLPESEILARMLLNDGATVSDAPTDRDGG